VKISSSFKLEDISSTAEVLIPKDPLERVIGQDEAVDLARIASKQKRNLLLVGPPGTGKSMIAQALALHLPPPTEEIQVVDNPEKPERPFIEIKTQETMLEEKKTKETAEGDVVSPVDVPTKVAETLGYRCIKCGTYSPHTQRECPSCSTLKAGSSQRVQVDNPFGDLMGLVEATLTQMGQAPRKKPRVKTTRRRGGKEEVVIYEPAGDRIKVLDEKALEKRRKMESISPRKVLVPVDRIPFILATGASETELLGDVRHDPYGGHKGLGTQPFERVVAGSIHEAHQGVLFIDEIPQLGQLQRYILTAMQDRVYPIAGRNPQSAGASVRVDDVPCNFIFVAACNIQDLPQIISPLRSRIVGSGYEVLVETTMPRSELNEAKLVQFCAQEVAMDGRIPHLSRDGVKALIDDAVKRAKRMDGKSDAITLRLRELGGLIRIAGDLATFEKTSLIEEKHIKKALKRAKPAEEQIKERYGSYYGGLARDISSAQKDAQGPYNYWNQQEDDDKKGYE